LWGKLITLEGEKETKFINLLPHHFIAKVSGEEILALY
jgi:hypothetical protein